MGLQSKALAAAAGFFENHPDIALLVVPEDGVSGNAPFIKAAHETDVPVLTAPYGNGSYRDLEDALARKKEQNDLRMARGIDGLLVRLLYPKWVKKGCFSGAVLFPAGIIIVREFLGMSLRDPWCVNGGYSDKIAVESRAMQKFYDDEGVPRDKCALTGTVYADILYHAMQSDTAYVKAFENAARIEDGVTRILLSWPPSYHAGRAHLCAFDSYEDLTRAVFTHLAGMDNVKVSVSLHPAASDEARAIIADCGFDLSEEYVIDLIPKHDVFISCYSSTTRWAIAAAKPVVNYDFYGFGLPVYDGCKAVLTMRGFDEYKEALEKLCNDRGCYAEMAAAQKAISAEWGMMDGKNAGRIHDLCVAMVQEGSK